MSTVQRRKMPYHALFVIAGAALAVLPAAIQLAWQLPLFLMYLPGLGPEIVTLYITGWIGLASLWVVFGYFREKREYVSPPVWLGVCLGIIAASWSTWTRLSALESSCRSCVLALELISYNPFTLCLAVAAHWVFLYVCRFSFHAASPTRPTQLP